MSLLALTVGGGLKVMEELVAIVGPTSRHPRTVTRHGSRQSQVVLGGRTGAAAGTGRRTCSGTLPEAKRPWIRGKLREAWAQEQSDLAERRLSELARACAQATRAAVSLREVLAETLTITRPRRQARLRPRPHARLFMEDGT